MTSAESRWAPVQPPGQSAAAAMATLDQEILEMQGKGRLNGRFWRDYKAFSMS